MSVNIAEFKVIASWNIDTEFLAIDLKNKGGSRFTKISKSDVTILQLFLKKVGYGKLAGKEFSMMSVATHLNRNFTWSDLSNYFTGSVEHKAYLNVCRFANKMLMHNKVEELNINVSKHSTERSYFTCHARASGQGNDVKLQQGLKIYWNPEFKVKHLKALVSNRRCPIENVIIKSGDKILSSEVFLKFPSLMHVAIFDSSSRKADKSSSSLFYRSLFKQFNGKIAS